MALDVYNIQFKTVGLFIICFVHSLLDRIKLFIFYFVRELGLTALVQSGCHLLFALYIHYSIASSYLYELGLTALVQSGCHVLFALYIH